MGSTDGLQGITEVTPQAILFILAGRQRRSALDGQNALQNSKTLKIAYYALGEADPRGLTKKRFPPCEMRIVFFGGRRSRVIFLLAKASASHYYEKIAPAKYWVRASTK